MDAGRQRSDAIERPQRRRQHLAVHARTQQRRRGEPRVQIADEVDGAAQRPRQRRPHVDPLGDGAEHLDARVVDEIEPGVLPFAQRVHREQHLVTAIGQEPHGGVVIAQVLGRRDHEQQAPRGRRCDAGVLVVGGRLAARLDAPGERRDRSQDGAPERGRQGFRRGRRWRRAELRLDGIGKHPGCRYVHAARPDERLDEGAAGERAAAGVHRGGELADVLVERRRQPQQAAVDVLEVLEVQRAVLLPGEFGVGDGEDRPPDDPRFDQRARVHAHDRHAVVHRVEVLGARVGIHGIGAGLRPDAERLIERRIEAAPLLGVLRVRPDQNRRLPQVRVRRPANGRDPPAHEADLVRRDERRRAEIQQQRAIGRHADPGAEDLAGRRWLLQEPVVVGLRAGDRHAVWRHAVQLGGLLTLALVPDDDAARLLVDQSLGRQVIPAADAEHGADAEPARRSYVLDLLRAEVQERRQQQQIRAPLAQHAFDHAARRHGALRRVEERAPRAHGRARSEER